MFEFYMMHLNKHINLAQEISPQDTSKTHCVMEVTAVITVILH